MTFRHELLAMTAAAGLFALPLPALAQQGSGSSMQTQTTQTTPQQGPLSGAPAARAGADAGSTTGRGNNAGSATGGVQTSQGRDASGGVMAQGGSTSSPRDGTPGNPPSTATQRALDSATGSSPTPADGTPGNPPGTAAGRALGTGPGTGTTATGATGAAAAAVDSATLRSGRRASKVVGSNVYNENNESIGEVDDLILPQGGTGSPVAVISVGGFLGIGAKLVAVPYDRLQMNAERNRWTLPGATKDSLTSLPTFSYDNATTGGTERRG
jgi:sporulation protein YlmC with PRC-barrel domain